MNIHVKQINIHKIFHKYLKAIPIFIDKETIRIYQDTSKTIVMTMKHHISTLSKNSAVNHRPTSESGRLFTREWRARARRKRAGTAHHWAASALRLGWLTSFILSSDGLDVIKEIGQREMEEIYCEASSQRYLSKIYSRTHACLS